MAFWFGCAPTSTASDIVNKCHRYKKVTMTNKQWDKHGWRNHFRRPQRDSPICPRIQVLL